MQFQRLIPSSLWHYHHIIAGRQGAGVVTESHLPIHKQRNLKVHPPVVLRPARPHLLTLLIF